VPADDKKNARLIISEIILGEKFTAFFVDAEGADVLAGWIAGREIVADVGLSHGIQPHSAILVAGSRTLRHVRSRWEI
jgi:hypothetical protein